ncbi:MAG: GAF domain-containing sensor histidine kinase [Acidimicrobiia bacterium]|nr:GAF domain-containing sensor histidine kinase [Acidimicrobiia bacterium]
MRTADRRSRSAAPHGDAPAADDFAAAAALASALTADPERASATLMTRAQTLLGTRELALYRFGLDGEPAPLAGSASTELAAAAARMRTSTRPLVASGSDAAAAAGITGVRSVAAAAVRLRGKPVGAVVAVSRTATFSARHGALVSYCADLAALTIERSAAAGIEGLVNAGEQLATVLESKQLLEALLDGAQRLLGGSGGFVCLVDEDGRGLRTALFRMLPRESVEATMVSPGFAGLVHEPGPRVDVPGPNTPFGALKGSAEAFVTLPLRAEGRPLGLVCTALRDAPAPDPTTLRLAAALAQHAATSVRTTMLFERMRTREAEMAAIVASFPNPLVVVDPDGDVVLVNPAAEVLFGLSSDFERGRSVGGRLPAHLDELILSGSSETREVRLGTPEPHHYTASVSRVAGADGDELGRVLILADRTAEERAERLHADFVAVIGHELRTPLTLIKGFVKTLMRRGADMPPDAVGDALRTIDEQSLNLEHLIEDLLFLSQAEQAQPKLYCEWGDLVGFVREWTADQAARWKPRGREVVFRSQVMEVPLYFDRAKLVQMLGHLVDNALKYSEDRVVVEIARTSDWVDVSVIDYGIGIYSGDIDAIFDRFTQVNGTSTRERGGTGIGLHICKRLIEAHGGRVLVESQMGRGSQFTLRLPLDMTADGPASGHDAAGGARARDEAAATVAGDTAGFWWDEG